MNIQKFLEHITAIRPMAVILSSSSFLGNKEYTGSEYMKEIYKLAHKYNREFGTQKRIALFGEASCDYMKNLFAVMCSGNIAVPVNPSFAMEQLKDVMDIIEADALLVDKELIEECENIKPDLFIYAMDENVCEYDHFDYRLSDDEVNLMLLSSGTTGRNKAVKLSGTNLFTATPYHLGLAQGVDKSEKKALLLLPSHHVGGIVLMFEALCFGYQVHMSNPKRMLSDIKSMKFNKIFAVPSMVENILKNAAKSEKVKGQLLELEEVLCVGAAESSELNEHLKEMGVRFHTYYGMTETAGAIAGVGEYKYASCGKVFPFCTVKLEDNEICVKGDNVSPGYYNAPNENEYTFRDGWLYTGDLGKFDEDGRLYITGRKKNIIILSNGENVSPEELENKILAYHVIKECMVYADGEEICADIYMGDKLTDELREMAQVYIKEVNSKLPLAQKIKRVNISEEELVKNATGKIVRR